MTDILPYKAHSRYIASLSSNNVSHKYYTQMVQTCDEQMNAIAILHSAWVSNKFCTGYCIAAAPELYI